MRTRAKQGGMTLIEIMVVLAILALIMGVLVGPVIFRHWERAKVRTARLQVGDVAYRAYPEWRFDHPDEDCPADAEALREYTNGRSVIDPWGSALATRCGATAPPSVPFGALSLGPDRREGSRDDIRSWDEEVRGAYRER